MRAARFTRYGDPGVLTVEDVPTPEPRRGQVRVQVAAVSVNAIDTFVRSGRLRTVTGRRFPRGTGIDLVGTVDAVGEAVADLTVGDRVWGLRSDSRSLRVGTFAEAVVVEAAGVSAAPAGVDDVGAAALVASGTTAVSALQHVARVRPGETVLVRGATGGVGAALVQLAAALGAHVIALASAGNADLAHSLGAAEVYDYASTSPAEIAPVDVVVDTVGADLWQWRRRLTRGGRMVTIAFSSVAALAAIGSSTVFGTRRIRAFGGQPPRERLAEAARHVEAGRLRPAVHQVYGLSAVSEAHRALERGGVRGKIVVTLADPEPHEQRTRQEPVD